MNGNERQKWLMIAVTVAIGLLLLDRLALSPLVNLYRGQGIALNKRQASVEQGKSLIDREASLRQRWADMQGRSFPADASMAEDRLLKSVAQWAQTSRVTLMGLTPQWRQRPDGDQTLDCLVRAKGPLQAVTKFLHALETDDLPLRLEQCDISARDEGGHELTLSAKFSGVQIPKGGAR